MSCTEVGIIVLYAVAGLLPLFGFGHSFIDYHRWTRYVRKRQKHIDCLRRELNVRWQSAMSPEEQDVVSQWKAAEDAKLDPRGKRYGDTGGFLFDDGSARRRVEQHQFLLRDIKYVGTGVICGSLASIWSVLVL